MRAEMVVKRMLKQKSPPSRRERKSTIRRAERIKRLIGKNPSAQKARVLSLSPPHRPLKKKKRQYGNPEKKEANFTRKMIRD